MFDAPSPASEIPSSTSEEVLVDRSKLHANLLATDAATGSLSLGKYTADMGWASKPNSFLFWIDFLASASAGYGLIYWVSILPVFSLSQLGVAFLAAICMFRACLFMHEAVHSGKVIPGFNAAYNLYFGFVNKVPLYIYTPHRHHHAHEYYGTLQDPEYELLKRDVPNLLIPFVVMTLAPALMIIRFGVLPWLLPFIGTRGRNAVYQYASSFALNRHYKRPLPDAQERREWYRQDAACALYNAVFMGLCVAGILSWNLLWAWYGVAVITLLMNHYRVMASHAYLTGFSSTTRKQQILDSTTVVGSSWMFWLFPLGLRYHALHHLMPHVPYHHMAKLHRALVARLPADHPYLSTISKGFWAAVKRLPG